MQVANQMIEQIVAAFVARLADLDWLDGDLCTNHCDLDERLLLLYRGGCGRRRSQG